MSDAPNLDPAHQPHRATLDPAVRAWIERDVERGDALLGYGGPLTVPYRPYRYRYTGSYGR